MKRDEFIVQLTSLNSITVFSIVFKDGVSRSLYILKIAIIIRQTNKIIKLSSIHKVFTK